MSDRPTLAELRTRVFKHSVAHDTISTRAARPHVPSPRSDQAASTVRSAPTPSTIPTDRDDRDRDDRDTPARSEPPAGTPQPIGNWLARRVGRPSAVYGTWLAVRLGVSANQVTLAAVVAGLLAAVMIGTGSRSGFVAGVLLAQLAYWLDHVDGQVARWRRSAGLDGVYFDYLMHHAHAMALGFGLGFGLSVREGNPGWSAAGFLIASGWTFLGLHNDCRYKAFFQALKKNEGQSYRVDGASGGRPTPPEPWPRRGRAMLTWPLFKACEPHVVLVGMSLLGVVALVSPVAWHMLWRGTVLFMAVIAPTLAVGRAWRAVHRQAVSHEFDHWFRPIPKP